MLRTKKAEQGVGVNTEEGLSLGTKTMDIIKATPPYREVLASINEDRPGISWVSH